MAAADSVLIGPLTGNWQNLYDLCVAKYAADGLPMFDRICKSWKIESKEDNTAMVFWSRTSIGNNPAGSLGQGESYSSQKKDESLTNIYVMGNNQYIYVERSQ